MHLCNVSSIFAACGSICALFERKSVRRYYDRVRLFGHREDAAFKHRVFEDRFRFSGRCCRAGRGVERKKKRPGAGAQGLLRVTHRADEGSSAGVIDLLHTDCSASNATNVGAANAEIAQFAIAHAVQFSYGLTILAPVVQRACNVHGLIPRFSSPVAWDQLGFVF